MEHGSEPRGFPHVLTLYDVLGYITPGGVLLLSIYLFEDWVRFSIPTAPGAQPFSTPIFAAGALIYQPSIAGTWLGGTLIGLSLLAVAYVLGHVIASVSSLTIDRILLFKGYGYPYSYLLNFSRDRRQAESHSGAFYRGTFFWINATILACFASLASFVLHWPLAIHRTIARTLPWVSYLLTSLVAIKLVLGVTRSRRLRPFVHRHRWAFKGRRFFQLLFKKIYPIPYDLVGTMLSRVLNTRNSFNPQFRHIYRVAFLKRFGLAAASSGTNNFWLPYCFIADNSPAFSSLLSNWLTLYGFARNLSTAFYLGYIYAFCWLAWHRTLLTQMYPWPTTVLFFWPMLFLIACILMLIRYYYLYACYYTKFMYRAFIYLSTQQPPSADAAVPPTR